MNLIPVVARSLFCSALLTFSFLGSVHAIGQTAPLPDPAFGNALAPKFGEQTAVFAGGCFWGIEAIFLHVKGVISSTSGYAGGTAETANYKTVGTGKTGHAEVVRVVFDPSVVSYGQLLKVFFSVAHNPTELNRQGNDVGPQYRAEIFTTTPEQASTATAYIKQLEAAKVFGKPIVTKVSALERFYPAESYHQGYVSRNINDPYVVENDLPKFEAFRTTFPRLYRG